MDLTRSAKIIECGTQLFIKSESNFKNALLIYIARRLMRKINSVN